MLEKLQHLPLLSKNCPPTDTMSAPLAGKTALVRIFRVYVPLLEPHHEP